MKKGFTVVELMITLFVASLFIISGYQLYQVVVFRGSDARKLSEASTLAYEVLRSEKAPIKRYHNSALAHLILNKPLLATMHYSEQSTLH